MFARGAASGAYQTIYFPAQRIHFARDAPEAGVGAVIPTTAAGKLALWLAAAA